MITENLSTLKINRLTQAQYDKAVENGAVEENEFYLIPEIEKIGELSELKTNSKSTIVAAINELFDLLNK